MATRAYQKVTKVTKTHRTSSNKPKATTQRVASKRNKNAGVRKAIRRI